MRERIKREGRELWERRKEQRRERKKQESERKKLEEQRADFYDAALEKAMRVAFNEKDDEALMSTLAALLLGQAKTLEHLASIDTKLDQIMWKIETGK